MDLLTTVYQLSTETQHSTLTKRFLQVSTKVSSAMACGVLLTDRENKYLAQFLLSTDDKKYSQPLITPLSLEKQDSPLAYSLMSNKSIHLPLHAFIQHTQIKTIKGQAQQAIQLVPIRSPDRFGLLVLLLPLKAVLSGTAEKNLMLLGQHFMSSYQHLKKQAQERKRIEHLEQQLKGLQQKGATAYQRNRQLLETAFIGDSRQLKEMRQSIQRLAHSHYHVLIRGETGSGKELVVQELYRLSSALSGKLIIQNCAAIPNELLESELFGHEKGAFTGATKQKKGLFALADKGMLFLDEIGDLPLALQSKILRVLQDKRFRPLGSTTEISADFRLVTATHQPLEQMIHEGRFRQDLYYRLQQSCVNVPPLREHKSDIEALSRHFIRQFEQKNNIFNVRLTQQALQRLHRYHYPGNVRELQNIILQACLFVITDKDTLITQTMVESVLKASNLSSFQPANIQESAMGAALAEDIENVSLKEACHRFEARIIRDALDQHQGNRKKAAQQLQMPVRTLSYKCQKYDL